MNRILFVSDFFVEQIIGGGELNDYECFKALRDKNLNVERINSHMLNEQNLSQDCLYIISNLMKYDSKGMNLKMYFGTYASNLINFISVNDHSLVTNKALVN